MLLKGLTMLKKYFRTNRNLTLSIININNNLRTRIEQLETELMNANMQIKELNNKLYTEQLKNRTDVIHGDTDHVA